MYALTWVWGCNGKSKLHPTIVLLLVGAGITWTTAIGTSTFKGSDKTFRELSERVDQHFRILDNRRFLI